MQPAASAPYSPNHESRRKPLPNRPLPNTNEAYASANNSCPHCSAAAAQRVADAKRITDLETQLQWMTAKASAAADRLADYEDQLDTLDPDASQRPSVDAGLTPPRPVSADFRKLSQSNATAPPTEKRSNITGRFQSLLTRRTPSATEQSTESTTKQVSSTNGAFPIPSPQEDLQTLLTSERSARESAESALTSLQAELEELSAALFSQANEMVADERRMRAHDLERTKMLAERVQGLEEQAILLQSQARQAEEGMAKAEEEATSWSERAREMEGRLKNGNATTGSGMERTKEQKEQKERDEGRWRRVEALEKAVERLGSAKTVALRRSESSRTTSPQNTSTTNGT